MAPMLESLSSHEDTEQLTRNLIKEMEPKVLKQMIDRLYQKEKEFVYARSHNQRDELIGS
jgi:hypothetical protein